MGMLRDGLLARVGGNPKAEMPFLDHLEELRWRILWILAAVIVGCLAGLAVVVYGDVVGYLMEPGRALFGDDWKPKTLAPADNFFILIKISLTIGIILAFPVIVYQIWSFLAPALEKHEKRAIVPALYMGLVLFVAGVVMAYVIALPVTLRFLTGLLADFITPDWTASFYMAFIVRLLLAFGVVFELPIVVLVLSALGLVTPAFLRAKRRHAIVGITVVAAMVSPGDIISLTALMMVPMFLLYELSIVLSAIIWRRREAREREIEAASAPAQSVAETEPAPPRPKPPQPAPAPPEPTPYDHGDPARPPDADGPGAPEPGDEPGPGDEDDPTPDGEE